MRPEKTMYADATAGDLAQHKGGLLTSVKGQKNLPRYFARVMRIVQTLQVGSLILVLPDGRKFIAHGQPGVSPISKQALHAELHVHNAAFFFHVWCARVIWGLPTVILTGGGPPPISRR
jgi:hypothetical protein